MRKNVRRRGLRSFVRSFPDLPHLTTCQLRLHPVQTSVTGVLAAVVLAFTSVAKVTGQNGTGDAANYAACEGYLTDLQAAFANGDSLDDVKAVAYDQYVRNPSGPYVFCWGGTPDEPEDDAKLMLLAIHPYLEVKTLGDLVQGKHPDWAEDKEQVLLENLRNEPGSLFNYTEAFDQVATEDADLAGPDTIVAIGPEQSLVGFIEEDPGNPDVLVHCACRYTGVPSGVRLNDNVASLTSGNPRAAALNAVVILLLSVVVGPWLLLP